MIWVALVVGSYLLGSVSFSYLVVRRVEGRDIRRLGSGNAGATNVLRTAGTWPALAAVIGDLGKGAAPVLLGRSLGAQPAVLAATAVAAVLGHVFPVFLGFRGGKGVATAAGALGMMAPEPAMLSAALFFLVVGWTRYMSLGSLCGLLAFPVLVLARWWRGDLATDAGWLLASSVAVAALVVWRHRENIERLWAGTERRLGEPDG